MMVYKICALGVLGALLYVVVQNEKKDYAITILIIVGVMILSLSLPYFASTIEVIKEFLALCSEGGAHIATIFKIIAVSYIAQFASDICKDSGADSIGKKIELGAKFFIMYLSVPIFLTLFHYINGMMQ